MNSEWVWHGHDLDVNMTVWGNAMAFVGFNINFNHTPYFTRPWLWVGGFALAWVATLPGFMRKKKKKMKRRTTGVWLWVGRMRAMPKV